MTEMTAKPVPSPVVIFGEDWGAHPSSTQHLAKRLMADREIIWVNSIGLRRPRVTDLARVVQKLKAMVFPNQESQNRAADQPTVLIQPKAISWPGSRLAAAINRRTLPKQIRAALDSLGKTRPVLWTSLPSAVEVIGHLQETAVVYYAGDDFGALAGVDHKPVLQQEQRLADVADIIIAASPEIAKRFPRGKTFVIPHGVDLNLFATRMDRAADMPETGRPIAGFYGALDEWLDVDLLSRTAARMTDWDFVFVGPERTDVSALAALPNVRLLGPRPHSELPRYSQHWTASMLPFRDNAQIQACNPLKLREYMATGTPIVSTEFPAARRFSKHIRFVDDADSFEAALRDTPLDCETVCQKRRKAVADQSWRHRATEVRILIDALQNGTDAPN